jgi:hypothetical protein
VAGPLVLAAGIGGNGRRWLSNKVKIMDSTIILIGPMSAGKSTIGGLLAEKLGWPRYSLDEKRWEYYQEIGYDEAFADNIRQAEGMEGLLRYWKPFEADSRTLQINEHFVKHPSNQLLAKKIVYTNGKTPDETCAEILQHIAKEGAGFG